MGEATRFLKTEAATDIFLEATGRSPLTLLSGSNASGKSSALQALVLLHQTMREHEWSTRLMLNGAAIRLGTVSDVVDKVHGRRTFEVGVEDREQTYHWTFAGERSEMSMAIERVVVDGAANQRARGAAVSAATASGGRERNVIGRSPATSHVHNRRARGTP